MENRNVGRTMLGCALGVLAGLLQPLLLSFSVIALPGSILIAALYAWAGPYAAMAAAASSAASLYGLYGMPVSLAFLVACAVPAAVSAWTLHTRKAFFWRLKAQLVAQFASLALLIFGAYLALGGSIADAIAAKLGAYLAALPDALFLMLTRLFAASGLLAEAPAALTAEARAALTESFVSAFASGLKQSLPALVLFSGTLTAVLTAVWPSLICVKRGDEPQVPYEPLYTWFVPNRATFGALGGVLLALLMNASGVSGADTLAGAFTTLLYLLLTIQAFCGLAGRMRRAGMSKGQRALILTLMTVFGLYLLRMLGAFRCLFGRRGLIMTIRTRRKSNDDEGGDGE